MPRQVDRLPLDGNSYVQDAINKPGDPSGAEGFSLYLVDRVVELRARYPELVIEILTDVRPLDLLRGEADLAFRLNPTTQRDLVTRVVCPMPWRMFASDAYVARRGRPSPPTNLRGHEIVGYEAPLGHVPQTSC
jgi:DNA-binding transcriptional LysR family regulator